ncbi:MAG: hypothetical protein NWE95_07720 [Candidatus Bathyarchaeota archaeon]|nr:hypothetical protein [Candidatus Bathyarchaeota archaeon]
MGSLKSLAQGFLVATGLVWVFNIIALFHGGDAWLGLMYLLILLIPVTSITMLKLNNLRQRAIDEKVNWRNLLFAFQGVALAFWMFDIITTVYAIDVTRLAIEINPLGWPLGILGAFAFYGPTLAFSYVLLFKLKENISFYAAIPLTLLTLGMSVMNLVAGAQNFQVFVDTAVLATDARYGLLGLILAVNLAVQLALRRAILSPKYKIGRV